MYGTYVGNVMPTTSSLIPRRRVPGHVLCLVYCMYDYLLT